MKEYIPFTQARRQRLYAESLHRQRGNHEVLLQIEYPDGTEQMKPADWDSTESCWKTPDEQRFYSKGFGGDPGILNGVPIVHVDASNAGVVSREAAKAAAREDDYDYVDSDGNALEVVETDEDGAPIKVTYSDDVDSSVASDGGAMDIDDVDLAYDLSAPEEYDGEIIKRRLAGYYDPYPVSRQEADQAVEHAKSAAADAAGTLKTFLIGFGVAFAAILLFIVLMWLLGQIGGGEEGGNVIPAMVNSMGVFR
ncbi:hypothetical protein OB905_13170 [Halobacteria archaeon AArc-dxtr1]|nr:hypothetical protein [Halobacteria archaeon AArc-dxtr1]